MLGHDGLLAVCTAARDVRFRDMRRSLFDKSKIGDEGGDQVIHPPAHPFDSYRYTFTSDKLQGRVCATLQHL